MVLSFSIVRDSFHDVPSNGHIVWKAIVLPPQGAYRRIHAICGGSETSQEGLTFSLGTVGADGGRSKLMNKE